MSAALAASPRTHTRCLLRIRKRFVTYACRHLRITNPPTRLDAGPRSMKLPTSLVMFRLPRSMVMSLEDSNLDTSNSLLLVRTAPLKACGTWSDKTVGGTIGTGLFLGIGRAFTQAGPLSVLLGYTFTGLAVYGMMMCLGEMATWLPLPGAIPQFCARYVDDAMGFAVGWNNWYSNAITLCAEISAASTVIQVSQKSIIPSEPCNLPSFSSGKVLETSTWQPGSRSSSFWCSA